MADILEKIKKYKNKSCRFPTKKSWRKRLMRRVVLQMP